MGNIVTEFVRDITELFEFELQSTSKLTFLSDTRVKDNRALKYPYRLVFDQ